MMMIVFTNSLLTTFIISAHCRGNDVTAWQYSSNSTRGIFMGLNCNGNETSVGKCRNNRRFSTTCSHLYDLGIGCGLQGK